MPKAIAALVEESLANPVKIVVTPGTITVARVEHSVAFVPSDRKRALLATLLRDPAFARVLVFTRTKHGADGVVRHLGDAGIEAIAIHGNKSQLQREPALAAFRAGQARVLIATDIAARGIDGDGVSHVVNFELPNVPEDYVHRIGRTARAGAAGIAIAFCGNEERPFLRDIEALIRRSIRVMPGMLGATLDGSSGHRTDAAPPGQRSGDPVPASAAPRAEPPRPSCSAETGSPHAKPGVANAASHLHRSRDGQTRKSAAHQRVHAL
jgi:ATP-dependent RNA helicase RhlE